jgi:hypothetical protein
MKKYILLFLAFMLPLLSKAEVRSREGALEIAENFFGKAMTKSAAYKLDMIWDGSDIMTKSAGSAPAFYVFDNVSGPGFVVVSGDDRVKAVLGYSFENEFEVDDMPPHFIEWMQEIENQIRYVRSSSTYSTRTSGSDDPGNPVVLYETALWNQSAPYNDYCPYDGAERSVTGCVATAMAIVMKYHEWPDAGVGTIPAYVTDTQKIEVDAIELGYKYDWDNMLMSYNAGSSAAQNRAVARLMADCGAALQMNYSASASGAPSEYIPIVLSTYMKYDKSAVLRYRGLYSYAEWHEIIQTEIKTNGPVLYAGHSDEGGHAFVLDGYTDNQYYHLNWGWGGHFNGYFLLDALNPDGEGIGGSEGGYNFYQSAVFNVAKDHGGRPEECLTLLSYDGVNGLESDSEVFEKGVPFYVKTGLMYNASSYDYTGKIGLAVADENNQVKEELLVMEVNDLPSGYGYKFDTDLTYTIDLRVGDRLIAVFWDNETSKWKKIRGNVDYGVVDFIPLTDQYDLGESTSFSFNTKTREIILMTKGDVDFVVIGPSGEQVASVVTVQNEPVVVPTADLPAGRYKMILTKNEEYAEYYVVLGTKEDSHE